MAVTLEVKKGFLQMPVDSSQLVYGGKKGVTRRQAEDAFIQGFMQKARKRKSFYTKHGIKKGVEFLFY